MSASWEVEDIMEGLNHGACFYFTKPVTIKQLNNIWQHVYKKRACEINEIEDVSNVQVTTSNKRGSDDEEAAASVNQRNCKNSKRRKLNSENEDEKGDNEDANSQKKPRIIWNPKLHLQFMSAIHEIGFDKCVPKKILELMNVPGLTRENVASHLQKYRLFLRRIKDENKSKAICSRPFRSIFASVVPEFMQNVHQRSFYKTLVQPNMMAIQPGLAGSVQSFNTLTKFPDTDPISFFNQEAQRNNSIVTQEYGQSLLNNEGNTQQLLPQIRSQPNPSPLQRYNGYTVFQKAHPHMNLGSSSYGNIQTGNLGGIDKIQMRPAHFRSGQLGNNFNFPIVQAQNDLSSMGHLGSLSSFNDFSTVDNANNHGGNQTTITGGIFGLPQNGSIGEPMNNINTGYNPSNVISNGKITIEANRTTRPVPEFSSMYFNNANTQELASFTNIPNINQSLGGSTGTIDPQNDLVTGLISTTEADNLQNVVKNSAFQNSPTLPELFPDADLIDLVFNQPQEGARAAEPEFDIRAYELDNFNNVQ